MLSKEQIRNIAIIAHVDHGKTTLVDAMLRQSGAFRENEQVVERVMDSNDLERERGITILAKNTSLFYNGLKINIVDTPGHADFGGEVERSLQLVDGVLLLVDAFEGCMPQTRFVLKKALALNLKLIIVVNKVDRHNARPYEVVDEVLELLIDLDATDEQIESPVIFTSGRDGWASLSAEDVDNSKDLKPLFELIERDIPHPESDGTLPFSMLVSNIDYDDYTGRIAIGKIESGTMKAGSAANVRRDEIARNVKISSMYVYEGLRRAAVDEAGAGEIVAVSGIGDINIGDTICDVNYTGVLPFVKIDSPVLSMNFSVNNSPFAGREGTYVTSRHLRDRLYKELESNISLKVEDTDSPETLTVSGRGELHLSVLIENMRRQGYEFAVSKPTVITREINGALCEPIERLMIDVPEEYSGVVMERAALRKGTLVNMFPASQGYTRIEFLIPSRGLIGFRNQLLTDTKGTVIINSLFECYEEYKGDIEGRTRGSLIAHETGETNPYGLFNAQDRGTLFIGTGVKVYEGMVVGENSRIEDVKINVCKKKHVTNIRASGSDDALRLTPHKNLSLEQYLEFIGDDELLEVTPKNLRIRKKILNAELRAKSKK